MDALDAWLDARDGRALEAAWDALSPTTVALGPEPITGIGILGFHRDGWVARRLASAWLGRPHATLAWLTTNGGLEEAGAPPPIFEIGRDVELCFLENARTERSCYETWDVREVVAGDRAVQRVQVGWRRETGYEGGEGGTETSMRYIDRAKRIGACVHLYRRTVSFIGDAGAAMRDALDLLHFSPNFRLPWPTCDPDQVRALVAQLASEIDAHYDQSASWPQHQLDRADEDYFVKTRFGDGPHAVVLDAYDATALEVALEGLPWDHLFQGGLRFAPDGAWGHFNIRVPQDAALRILARLETIEGLELSD